MILYMENIGRTAYLENLIGAIVSEILAITTIPSGIFKSRTCAYPNSELLFISVQGTIPAPIGGGDFDLGGNPHPKKILRDLGIHPPNFFHV